MGDLVEYDDRMWKVVGLGSIESEDLTKTPICKLRRVAAIGEIIKTEMYLFGDEIRFIKVLNTNKSNA